LAPGLESAMVSGDPEPSSSKNLASDQCYKTFYIRNLQMFVMS
jgi:hypothetical protein